jgi:hypothetical protein
MDKDKVRYKINNEQLLQLINFMDLSENKGYNYYWICRMPNFHRAERLCKIKNIFNLSLY